jgi:hypothetical protein
MPRSDSTPDDVTLLADRLRLGLPLRGFDGREIPLYDLTGQELDPIDAAYSLLLSGASLLPAEDADAYVDAAMERAQSIEIDAFARGDSAALVAAKVTAVLVSAAVRAAVIGQGSDTSPSALNRATRSWYQVHDLRRRELLELTREPEPRWMTA